MPNVHEKVGMSKPGFSSFDLSHERKLSCNMGDLIPVYLEEVLPGDQFKVKTEIMMRLAPLVAPVMHRVNVYLHFFFVPNRITWPGDETVPSWQQFITGGRLGTSVPTMPLISVEEAYSGNGSLADYLGLPPNIDDSDYLWNVTALPFRAYQQIFNDYYRDPNLQVAVDITADLEAKQLRKRAWEKDYFTSALPWPQRGPDVSVPVDFNYKDISNVVAEAGGPPSGGTPPYVLEASASNPSRVTIPTAVGNNFRIENLEDDAVQVSINELRTSTAIQRWLEKQARGGYRYIETLLSHFGVRSSDARLQRAEYLGGGKQPIVISEVLNTSATATEPQGNMSGHGYSVGTTNTFKRRFEEHGYVMGIMSVLPRTAYQQGVPRHFSRTEKLDFYWPEFANLGEQEILNQELYFQSGSFANSIATFGYQQRYAEYKYAPSTVHGDFKTTLDFWHMGRIFATPPSLNSGFMTSDPTHRIFAVEDTDQHKLWVQIYNDVKARRPMPYFSNPSLR